MRYHLSFHNCNDVAISLAQSANITVASGNNITHACVHITYIAAAARVQSSKLHIPLIRVALVDFVDYSKDNIQSQSHRVGGKTLGNVVVCVIVMTHDGVLSGECD